MGRGRIPLLKVDLDDTAIGTAMALQIRQKPIMRRSQPSVTTPAPLMASRMGGTSSLSSTIGNQAYRTLAESQERSATAPSALPNPVRLPDTTSANSIKPPPLSPEMREQMGADVNRIAKILQSSFFTGEPDSGDQTRIIELIRKYERLDDESSSARLSRMTPNLDHFLILLKSRAYSHSGIKSLFQDQYSILYDALWYRLRGYWLEEFKRVVRRSQTQPTAGPGDKDVENGLALMAKQEAMGMWGMLKGMGTGLVGIAGPYASQKIAEQFDETARILFGHEWDSSEPLLLGMNASQIGTMGGDVIWQLVMFARGAGPAKSGKVMALVDSLKKVMGVGAGLQGVALGATGIARVIEARQTAGQDISVQALIQDKDFIDQLVVMVSSAIGAAMAGRGAPATKADAITRARIQVLLSNLHVTASLARLSEIAASDKTAEEKEREYGQVVASLIPQLFAAGIDVHAVAQSKKIPASPGSTDEQRAKQPRASEQLQEKMVQEATHQLAPREAQETPVEVKSGPRGPHYKAPKEGSNTIGKPSKSLEQARKLYDDVIAETSGKHEVGIWQKGDGTYVVRIGQMTEVNAPRDWRPIQHFHTNAPDIALWRMPARADIAETSLRAAGTGHPVTELVEYPLPDGKRGRAAYTVNPDNSVKVEFIDPAGQRIVKDFPSVKDYNEYHDAHKIYAEPESESYKSLIKDLDKTFGKLPTPEKPDTATKTMAGAAPKNKEQASMENKKRPGLSSVPPKIDKSRTGTKTSPSTKKPVVASPSASRTSAEWLTNRGTPEYRALGMKVLRGRFSETPAMKRLWKRASQGCQQSDEGYDMARDRFWKLIATSTDNDARLIRAILTDAGYETPMGGAANVKMTWATKLDPKRLAKLEKTKPDVAARLRMSAEEARRGRTPEGLQTQQRKESIEHAIPRHPAPGSAMEKKAAKYPTRFLDPDNLGLENLYENMLMGNKPSVK